jgi:capsular polysaccharide transport system permease protein
LTRYRNQAEILDPVQAAGGGQDNATALDLDGAMLRAQLQSMMLYAPRNPGIPALKRRVAAVEAQAARLKDSLAGGKASISNKLGDFEELVVKRELAEHLFENAQKEFNAAVQEAGRQQIYIEPIARPNLPDAPSEPRRLRYIATTMLLSFWAFLILYLLVSGGREHLNLS